MLMWRESRTAVSQRSPEIIVHRECVAEAGRRNGGRNVSTQLLRPKFWKNRRYPKEKKKKKIEKYTENGLQNTNNVPQHFMCEFLIILV
jgi:hypothetical protein